MTIDSASETLPAPLAERLGAQFAGRFTTAPAQREHHGGGGMHLPNVPPQAVVYPEMIAEIQDIVRACAEAGAPMIPFGAGTSLECHVGAPKGGVSIDMSRMNRILRVSVEDQDCTVEAGVCRQALNAHLRDTGLFFPVDPGADPTLGGMAATRASGTTTLHYGGMRENVLNLTVVTADARVIQTARRARKSAAGYDLTRLFVGSEGTLGVIAEATLRLSATPEAIAAAVCAFPDPGSAVSTVIEAVQLGVSLARAEFLDGLLMQAVNRRSHLNYAAADTLFLEFHGSPEEVRAGAERAAEVSRDHGGGDFRWATEVEDRNRLWRASRGGACGDGPAPRRSAVVDGCLRARQPPCRMRRRDQGRSGDRAVPRGRARSCGRRQFPCDPAC